MYSTNVGTSIHSYICRLSSENTNSVKFLRFGCRQTWPPRDRVLLTADSLAQTVTKRIFAMPLIVVKVNGQLLLRNELLYPPDIDFLTYIKDFEAQSYQFIFFRGVPQHRHEIQNLPRKKLVRSEMSFLKFSIPIISIASLQARFCAVSYSSSYFNPVGIRVTSFFCVDMFS